MIEAREALVSPGLDIERELECTSAIDEAVRETLARDDDVFVMGEDVGLLRDGLKEEFPDRIRNKPPLARRSSWGGTEAAYSGLRSIVGLMFIDFFGVAMDQIYNQLAKITCYSDGNLSVPLVIRAAYGGGYRDAGQHQQCLYSDFRSRSRAESRGSIDPLDAEGMMMAAISADDPVLFRAQTAQRRVALVARRRRPIARRNARAVRCPCRREPRTCPRRGVRGAARRSRHRARRR